MQDTASRWWVRIGDSIPVRLPEPAPFPLLTNMQAVSYRSSVGHPSEIGVVARPSVCPDRGIGALDFQFNAYFVRRAYESFELLGSTARNVLSPAPSWSD